LNAFSRQPECTPFAQPDLIWCDSLAATPVR
jgi:hypothetical protein